MMISRMNRHKFGISFRSRIGGSLILPLFILSQGAMAAEFSCLKALIPATDHYWVHKTRKEFSLPAVSESGSAIAISRWAGDHLEAVYIYTESSTKMYEKYSVTMDDKP